MVAGAARRVNPRLAGGLIPPLATRYCLKSYGTDGLSVRSAPKPRTLDCTPLFVLEPRPRICYDWNALRGQAHVTGSFGKGGGGRRESKRNSSDR